MPNHIHRIETVINGRSVSKIVESRLTLADFLRDGLNLHGTKLGCEHGVCGSCTVFVDSQPTLACVTLAVACNGRTIRTIEDFDEDALMHVLRSAFNAEHAVQCGFCTPGMLLFAHDLVRRAKSQDEADIRRELRGNLCRCTGYLGIVRAIRRVLDERRA
jgi:carbon-monoxide dehydrogenase small subunit